MSAAVLREAARLMRKRSRFGAASETADWLDDEAEQFEKVGSRLQITAMDVVVSTDLYRSRDGLTVGTIPPRYSNPRSVAPQPDRHALAVARAYLGSES